MNDEKRENSEYEESEDEETAEDDLGEENGDDWPTIEGELTIQPEVQDEAKDKTGLDWPTSDGEPTNLPSVDFPIRMQIEQDRIVLRPFAGSKINLGMVAGSLELTMPDPDGEITTHPIKIDKTDDDGIIISPMVDMDIAVGKLVDHLCLRLPDIDGTVRSINLKKALKVYTESD